MVIDLVKLLSFWKEKDSNFISIVEATRQMKV
jgi:hypothetical protein